MKYLPILDELFASDSVIFLLIGFVVSLIVGIGLKTTKKNLIGLGASVVLYALCEVLSNIRSNFLIEILLLFVGTFAIGGIVGFLIGTIVSLIRKSR